MKKLYWLFVSVLLLAFSACDNGDDEPIVPTQNPNPINDTTSPQIAILSPVQNDTYLEIGVITINAEITDDVGLDKVDLYFVNPAGDRQRLDIELTGNQGDDRKHKIAQNLVPRGAVSGNYAILVEAKDQSGNSASSSASIKMIAEPLSTIDYKTAFMATGWFEYMGCCPVSWDVAAFNRAIYILLDKSPWDYALDSTFVNEFGRDFGGHDNLWAKWNVNKDNIVDESEMAKGIEELGFFKAWDKNQDNMVSEEEIADGVGTLWDVNKDNVVSGAEFERKLLRHFFN